MKTNLTAIFELIFAESTVINQQTYTLRYSMLVLRFLARSGSVWSEYGSDTLNESISNVMEQDNIISIIAL